MIETIFEEEGKRFVWKSFSEGIYTPLACFVGAITAMLALLFFFVNNNVVDIISMAGVLFLGYLSGFAFVIMMGIIHYCLNGAGFKLEYDDEDGEDED